MTHDGRPSPFRTAVRQGMAWLPDLDEAVSPPEWVGGLIHPHAATLLSSDDEPLAEPGGVALAPHHDESVLSMADQTFATEDLGKLFDLGYGLKQYRERMHAALSPIVNFGDSSAGDWAEG